MIRCKVFILFWAVEGSVIVKIYRVYVPELLFVQFSMYILLSLIHLFFSLVKGIIYIDVHLHLYPGYNSYLPIVIKDDPVTKS